MFIIITVTVITFIKKLLCFLPSGGEGPAHYSWWAVYQLPISMEVWGGSWVPHFWLIFSGEAKPTRPFSFLFSSPDLYFPGDRLSGIPGWPWTHYISEAGHDRQILMGPLPKFQGNTWEHSAHCSTSQSPRSLHSHLIHREVWDNIYFPGEESSLRTGSWQEGEFPCTGCLAYPESHLPHLLSLSLIVFQSSWERLKKYFLWCSSSFYFVQFTNLLKRRETSKWLFLSLLPASWSFQCLHLGHRVWQNLCDRIFSWLFTGGDHRKAISPGFWQVNLSSPASPDVLQAST